MRVRWNWGTGVALVYAAFAIGTVSVVAFAMRTPVDLVSGDYYERSIRLDEQRQAEARAAALGDAFSIAGDVGRQQLTIRWPASIGAVSGTIVLYRPANAAADRAIAITPDQDARQIISTAGLAPGRWQVQVAWQAGGAAYYAERELIAADTPR